MTPQDKTVVECLFVAATAFLVLGFWIRRKEAAPRRWPQFPGLVVTSYTWGQPAGNGRQQVVPVVEYEFDYDGQTYRSSHWRLFNFSLGNAASAQAVTTRYAVGTPVTVYVNRHKPTKSVLETRTSALSWVPFAFAILFFTLSLLMM